jgi:hypothetical protein
MAKSLAGAVVRFALKEGEFTETGKKACNQKQRNELSSSDPIGCPTRLRHRFD